MCGIFFTTCPDEYGSAGLARAADQLSHRGPDCQATLHVGAVGAVHTRLAVIGLGAEGAQPMQSEGQDDLLVYNGEIVNYQSLASGRAMEVHSDTRLLLDILSTNDLPALGSLRGMFAFVYWNQKNRTVTAARDRFGIKPLFVLEHPSGALSFASELKPLLSHSDSSRIDPIGLAHFLADGHVGPSRTLLNHVRKLEPGFCYRWHLDLSERATLIATEPLNRGVWPKHGVASAVEDSVRAHLVADVEVGVFLSGGLDSTLLAALATREHPGLQAFTLSFPESPGNDEADIARHNAALMGLRHTVVDVGTAEMALAARELVRVTGEPLGDPAILPLSILARAARGHVPVVLAGEGADELFGGYRRYRVDAWSARTPSLAPAEVVNALGRRRNSSNYARSIEALMWGRRRGFRAHSALLLGEYPIMFAVAPEEASVALAERNATWRGQIPYLGSRSMAYDQSIWLPNTYLEKTDRATMLSGLEARVPYLDPVVAQSIGKQDIKGQLKTPLRALLGELQPDHQLPAIKKGLSVDVSMLLDADLSEPLRREFGSSTSLLADVFGRGAQRVLARRGRSAPILAYRVAQIGLWNELLNP